MKKKQQLALVPWYGSKRKLAPQFVQLFGPHKTYVEPFCGSMSVLFAKPRSRIEIVNDLHCDLVNLALVIQNPKMVEWLNDRIRYTILAEGVYRRCIEQMKKYGQSPFDPINDSPDPKRALCYWLVSWLGFSGLNGMNSHTMCSNFGVRWKNCASKSIPTVDYTLQLHTRLRRVQVLSRDAFRLLEKIPDTPDTVIYCDPPYVIKTSDYKHDFQTEQHQQLKDAISRFKHSRVFVSYYDLPELREMYDGWEFLSFDVVNTMSVSSRHTSHEVLICNHEPQTKRKGFSLKKRE